MTPQGNQCLTLSIHHEPAVQVEIRLALACFTVYYARQPDAGWSSLAARRAHNPKVVGSNPTPATNLSRGRPVRSFVFSVAAFRSFCPAFRGCVDRATSLPLAWKISRMRASQLRAPTAVTRRRHGCGVGKNPVIGVFYWAGVLSCRDACHGVRGVDDGPLAHFLFMDWV